MNQDRCGGDPPPTWCYQNSYEYHFYLWDEGVLLATFDYNDMYVGELFMYGPEGRFATMD